MTSPYGGFLIAILTGIATMVANFKSSFGGAFLDDVFYKLDVPMAIVGFDGKPVHANRALERLLEYSENELRKMHFREITADEDKERDTELFQEIIDGHRNDYWITKTWISKRGHRVTGVLQVMVIREDDGTIRTTIAVVQPLKNSNGKMKEESESTSGSFVISALKELRKTKRLGGVVTALFFVLLSFYLFITGGFGDILELMEKIFTN